jgi:pimeloyl-ACP methyl ester carboxylesterase
VRLHLLHALKFVIARILLLSAFPSRRTNMSRIFRVSAVVVGLSMGAAFGTTTSAARGPSNRCYGAIVSGIATTWPWAHNNKEAFPPPPGALPLWIQEFGPDVGVSSVRDLQVLFCDEE